MFSPVFIFGGTEPTGSEFENDYDKLKTKFLWKRVKKEEIGSREKQKIYEMFWATLTDEKARGKTEQSRAYWKSIRF